MASSIRDEPRTSAEQRVLREIIQSITRREPPDEGRQNGIQKLVLAFERANGPSDPSGTRERLMSWFGEDEAANVISALQFFFDEYWTVCRMAGRLLPFSFGGSKQREAILGHLSRILEEMRARDESLDL